MSHYANESDRRYPTMLMRVTEDTTVCPGMLMRVIPVVSQHASKSPAMLMRVTEDTTVCPGMLMRVIEDTSSVPPC